MNGAPPHGSYQHTWQRSINSPEDFWLEAADGIEWNTRPRAALEQRSPTDWSWFPGGRLNTSFNALDRHVHAGRGAQTALIYDSAMTGTQASLTYLELLGRVSKFAGALRANGVGRGDRVIIYLPMIPEAVIAMLACARIGAIHSVVFGGFAANELAARIDDARPSVIVTASGGHEPGRAVEYLPLVQRALALSAGSVHTVIVRNRNTIPGSAADYANEPVSWLDWDVQEESAAPADPVSMASEDPLYILYTSGTTGSPKGIVRDTGGHAVALAWSMRNIYNVEPGDVYWAASDVGWVVGHSYIVYAPLLVGATTVIYEGKPIGTPDAGAFWRVIQQYQVKVLFTAPTAVRAIRRVDPELTELAKYDVSCLASLFLAGERLDPETFHWANDGLHCPVVDHWWQTETGWAICANPLGIEELETRPGSATVPVPGYKIEILNSKGQPVSRVGKDGNIAIRLPLPPGNLLGIWGSKERFSSAYLTAFPGYYATGDSGHFDDDGYLYIMGRTDDVINVAGHRLSTGSLEEVLTLHPAVAECAVLGVHDALKGQRAAGFVTLKAGATIDHDTLATELVALVRDHVGPVAAFRDVTILERLPKTRSGKILRKTIRQIVDGEPYTVPPTIEDPTVLDDLKSALDASANKAPVPRALVEPT
ncbi:AMP-binding protein [Cryobacterium psychrophilum]|uniref:Propionyl-CoA synthetase n=1 Tax=Cryobacterium psychrophilum TaxID=41988 RepID=A0A4Y8KJC1_9MICO|nr:AMP-binding protein [Cryobacterium psychrophilum]TDW29243.1 propionyl-CoA synthetase [Cryobacterium psychrophilum]TFD74681.1 propionyl-CoA synthetase [Cryobacterium psychrophilum]